MRLFAHPLNPQGTPCSSSDLHERTYPRLTVDHTHSMERKGSVFEILIIHFGIVIEWTMGSDFGNYTVAI